jgi:hypothetical protein
MSSWKMPSYQDLQREEAIKERFGKKSTYLVCVVYVEWSVATVMLILVAAGWSA